jgi:hypothetical protein
VGGESGCVECTFFGDCFYTMLMTEKIMPMCYGTRYRGVVDPLFRMWHLLHLVTTIHVVLAGSSSLLPETCMSPFIVTHLLLQGFSFNVMLPHKPSLVAYLSSCQDHKMKRLDSISHRANYV